MTRSIGRFAILCGVLTMAVVSAAGSSPTADQDFVRQFEDLKSPVLSGAPRTFHSAESRGRAEKLQAKVRDMNAFFKDRLGVQADVSIAVLNASDWQQVRGQPPGMPGVVGDPQVIFMPDGPSRAMDAMMSRRNAIPVAELNAYLQGRHSTFEELAREFTDLIALHELGHVLTRNFGIPIGADSRWLNEFVASYWSYTYVAERRPELRRVFDLLGRPSDARPQNTTLDDFDALYGRVDDYGWYQGMFEARIREMYPKAGIAFLDSLRKLDLTATARDSADLVARLEAVAPGFTGWAAGFSRARQAGQILAVPLKTSAVDPILEAGSPDGKWAIYRQPDAPRRIVLRNLTTGQDRELITLERTAYKFAWSLDSRKVAISTAYAFGKQGEGNIHVVSVDGQVWTLPTGGDVMGWTADDEVFVQKRETAAPGNPATTRYLAVPLVNGTTREIYVQAARATSFVRAMLPGGNTLVMEGQGRLAVRDLSAGIERDVVRMRGATASTISPSGRSVAFFAGGVIYVAPLDRGFVPNPQKVIDLGNNEDFSSPTMWWTSDDALVVPSLTSWTGSIYRIDTNARGRATDRARLLLTHADWPAISPDGREIAHTSYDLQSTLGIIGANGGTDRAILTDPIAGQVYGWRSPSVVVLTGMKRLSTLDVRTGARATIYEGEDAGATDDYSPARDEGIFVGRKGDVTTLRGRSLATGAVRDIADIPGISEFRVSRDGKQIAYCQRTGVGRDTASELRVMAADGRNDSALLMTAGGDLDPIAWSPNGRYLAYLDTASDNPLRVVEVATRESWPLLAPAEQLDWTDQASWAPDGSFLVVAADGEVHRPVGKVFSGFALANEAPGDASAVQAATQKAAVPSSSRSRVILLGTGNPVADPDRFGPAVAIVVDDKAYLFDAGVGVVRRAAAAGIGAEKLTRVFLTHLHSDHTLGLPDLMLSPWVLGRPGPIDVYGPTGTSEMTRHLEEAYREDIAMRTYGLEPKHTAGAYRARPHEVGAGRVYEDDKIKVDAIPVSHGTWPEAFGYRIQTPDRTIVISGDTRPSPALAEACNGCDLLIHEVYSTALGRGADWQRYSREFHTSTAELAAIATQAKPRLLVLYHQMARGLAEGTLEAEITKAGYLGRIVSARDLDVY